MKQNNTKPTQSHRVPLSLVGGLFPDPTNLKIANAEFKLW